MNEKSVQSCNQIQQLSTIIILVNQNKTPNKKQLSQESQKLIYKKIKMTIQINPQKMTQQQDKKINKKPQNLIIIQQQQIHSTNRMQALNTFLALLARTEGRDKVLRLIQYACLHSLEDKVKGPSYNVYLQMRMVRKILRFLRSLEYSTKIREEFPKLMNSLLVPPVFLKHLTSILQNLFTVLYFLCDHRVCLGQLGVIDRTHAIVNLPRSMRFYFLQNVFGVLNNLIQIVTEFGKLSKKGEESMKKIQHWVIDLVKCLIDCFVALFYWKGKYTPSTIGKLGVISSAIAIGQSLGYV